jgi:signal transduction histidine kinase
LLTVQDNGCGFDPASISHGIGLRSQQLRAGLLGRSLQLQTAPGGGTTVCLA